MNMLAEHQVWQKAETWGAAQGRIWMCYSSVGFRLWSHRSRAWVSAE